MTVGRGPRRPRTAAPVPVLPVLPAAAVAVLALTALAFGAPAFGAPAFGAPAFGAPAFGASALGASALGARADAPVDPPAGLAPVSSEAAVVGTIEGRPVHAFDVLRGCDRALSIYAVGSTPEEFEKRAGGIVRGTLRSLITDRLIVIDAERALDPDERAKMDEWLIAQRDDLVLRHGGGERAKADAALRGRTGWGVEETVAERRRASLTSRRFAEIVEGRLAIDDEEIARVYRKHPDRYTTPPLRTVRMITTHDRAAADRIDRALDGGTPFAEAAAGPDNDFKRARGGLFAAPIAGADGLVEPLARAVTVLQAGERSRRMAFQGGFAWIQVDAITPGTVIPLAEAREEIEASLRETLYTTLVETHCRELVKNADMTPIDTMLRKTMIVVRERYAALAEAARTAATRSDRPER